MIGGLTTLLAAEATAAMKQQVRAAAWMAAGGVLGMGALAAGLVGLHQWMAAFMPALHATLWIAGGLAVLSLALLATGMVIRKAKRERSALNMTAMALAPTAVRMALRRISLSTVGIGGIVALGAVLGRKLGR
jgi:hypothetical protein